MALFAWGLAGLFLTADFFAGTNLAAGMGQYPGAAVSALKENAEPKEEKCIALTFDDGPHKIYTPKLLEVTKTGRPCDIFSDRTKYRRQ